MDGNMRLLEMRRGDKGHEIHLEGVGWVRITWRVAGLIAKFQLPRDDLCFEVKDGWLQRWGILTSKPPTPAPPPDTPIDRSKPLLLLTTAQRDRAEGREYITDWDAFVVNPPKK